MQLKGASLRFSSCFSISGAGLFLLALSLSASAETRSNEISKLLPKETGSFRQVGPIRPSESLAKEGVLESQAAGGNPRQDRHFQGAETEYVSSDGARLLVELVRLSRDSDAYSLLTIVAKNLRDATHSETIKIGREVGTASVRWPGRVAFFKGLTFVRVSEIQAAGKDASRLATLAGLIAERLEPGEADIPVLVKHMPDWEETQRSLVYLAGFSSLKGILPNQPILEAITSEGDADAALTSYGSSQFLIVEFNTPQLAGENDRNIVAKTQELRTLGQPVPSAYRRVGNYSVFVFNASSEQAGKELIDQVRYEQVVQWLGDNPYLLERAQRTYYQTTAGVLVSVVKASGLSLVGCLAIGGLFGALLFNWRRSRQRTSETFSDAGGMLRLNLDDMTAHDPAKLLGPGTRL